MALLQGKQIADGSIGAAKLAAGVVGGKQTTANKGMAAEVTTADGQEACATGITFTPAAGGYYVDVRVNGQGQLVGDGDKLHDCYFSADAGTTARAASAVVAGDKLYWVGTVAGFQLAVTDKISFYYEQ